MKYTTRDVYHSGSPLYTVTTSPLFRTLLLKQNVEKLKRIWNVPPIKWGKRLNYLEIDDWPKEISCIVAFHKYLVAVKVSNESFVESAFVLFSGLRQGVHNAVKFSWSCFLILYISAGRKSELIDFSNHQEFYWSKLLYNQYTYMIETLQSRQRSGKAKKAHWECACITETCDKNWHFLRKGCFYAVVLISLFLTGIKN